MKANEVKRRILHDEREMAKSIIDTEQLDMFLEESILITHLYERMSKEYWRIVKPILTSKDFIHLRCHLHHDDISTYTHSLLVSMEAYYFAKLYNLDYKSAAIGGLLHDFYCYDWHCTDPLKKGFRNKHFFTHAEIALKNAKKCFPKLMTKRIENIISSHMFGARLLIMGFVPLKKYFPMSKEAWLVIKVDTGSSFSIISTPRKLVKNTGLDLWFKKIKYLLK